MAEIGLFLSEEVPSRDVAEIGLFSMKDNLQLGCGRDRSILDEEVYSRPL